jgi:hypothetical protein
MIRSRSALAVGAAAVVAAALFGSCGAPRPGLSNGSVSACYRAIPTAKAAVNDPHAMFIGVHRVSADQVQGRLPPVARTLLEGDVDTTVCAIAFKGTFNPGQVTGAPPTQQGSYAIVLVTSRHLQILAAVVLAHLPRSLGKRTL